MEVEGYEGPSYTMISYSDVFSKKQDTSALAVWFLEPKRDCFHKLPDYENNTLEHHLLYPQYTYICIMFNLDVL